MKRWITPTLIEIVFGLLMLLMGVLTGWYVRSQSPVITPGTSRQTVIMAGNDVLHAITAQNISSLNGKVTIRVNVVQPEIQFGNYSGRLRYNATSHQIEFSNNAGTSWTSLSGN